MKHHSRPHPPIEVQRMAMQVCEEMRRDYQRQLEDKASDNWYRCLAQAGLVYREITGSTSKTERYLSRLAEVMERDRCRPTEEITKELERATGIELEVQG